jgi:Ricin-type beta-trefoil lectin domain
VPITGCSTSVTGVTVGFVPNCTAIAGTMDHPNTSIVIGFEETTDLLSKLVDDQNGQGFTAQWSLACDVDGATVTAPGSYTVTSTSQAPFTTIDLQSAVGSPDPNQCSVDGLTMHTLLPLVAVDIDEAVPFQIAVAALATTAAPGAIRQDEGTTKGGAHAALCADDTANGNAGAKIQAFQCLSDLADQWIQMPDGQFVHNGDCMTDTGGAVKLERCIASPSNSSGQVWHAASSGAGQMSNADGNGCLTAPSSGTIDTAALRVAACKGAVGQAWTVPNVTPV